MVKAHVLWLVGGGGARRLLDFVGSASAAVACAIQLIMLHTRRLVLKTSEGVTTVCALWLAGGVCACRLPGLSPWQWPTCF